MNINDYLQNQRAKPTQLSERQSPLTSPDDQLIEFHYDGRTYGLNLNHVQRNLEGELFQPEVINTFKAQVPEIIDRYFDRRVDSSPELGGQRWITTNGISKFLRREIESHFGGAKAAQKAIEVAAKRKSEAERQEIKVYLTPDKVGAGLSTGMRSNSPIDYAVTPSELLEMMQEAIAKPTTIAMRSAIESARFTLIPHVSQRDKVWLKNGIDPTDED